MAEADVRRLCGDKDAVFLDSTDINCFLSENGDNDFLAAADACDAIAAQLVLKGDRKVENVSVSYDPAQFQMRARALRAKASTYIGAPYAGGISKGDKDAVEDDDDRVTPAFRRDLFEYDRSQFDDGDLYDN